MGIPLFHVYGMVAGMSFAMTHGREHGDGAKRTRPEGCAGKYQQIQSDDLPRRAAALQRDQ